MPEWWMVALFFFLNKVLKGARPLCLSVSYKHTTLNIVLFPSRHNCFLQYHLFSSHPESDIEDVCVISQFLLALLNISNAPTTTHLFLNT